jgi:hypothetical protein
MKVHYDSDLVLVIPEKEKEQKKIDNTISSLNLLNNNFYFRETFLNTNCMKEACIFLNAFKFSYDRIWDAMCGVGLGSAIIKKYLNPNLLYCSDIDPECIQITKQNISCKVEVKDIFEAIKENLRWDLVLVDFNNFTMRNKIWVELLKEISKQTSILMFSDSACFGFNRFPKNLTCYEVDNEMGYYIKLSNMLNKNLYGVFNHRNTAVVLIGNLPLNPPKIKQCLTKINEFAYHENNQNKISNKKKSSIISLWEE